LGNSWGGAQALGFACSAARRVAARRIARGAYQNVQAVMSPITA
jgi:hypothetical protein